eukprot:361326-Chlamydomonas_euryale.AAC.5
MRSLACERTHVEKSCASTVTALPVPSRSIATWYAAAPAKLPPFAKTGGTYAIAGSSDGSTMSCPATNAAAVPSRLDTTNTSGISTHSLRWFRSRTSMSALSRSNMRMTNVCSCQLGVLLLLLCATAAPNAPPTWCCDPAKVDAWRCISILPAREGGLAVVMRENEHAMTGNEGCGAQPSNTLLLILRLAAFPDAINSNRVKDKGSAQTVHVRVLLGSVYARETTMARCGRAHTLRQWLNTRLGCAVQQARDAAWWLQQDRSTLKEMPLADLGLHPDSSFQVVRATLVRHIHPAPVVGRLGPPVS